DKSGHLPCIELSRSRVFPSLDDSGRDVRGPAISASAAKALLHAPAAHITRRTSTREARTGRSILMLVHDRRIDRRVLEEARTLVGSGWEVTVLAGPSDPGHVPSDEDAYPDVQIIRVGRRSEQVRTTVRGFDIAPRIPWARFS